MKCKTIDQECEALRTIRGRWQRRGWKFTPLNRLDGTNETSDSIDALRNSPVCWSNVSRAAHGPSVELLLDDLDDLLARALQPWNELRTVFECAASGREFSRWPDGMCPARIHREARYRFWELVTTSRFSVNEVPSIAELQTVNWTDSTVTVRHVAGLAAVVCIIEAIDALEQIESWWVEDTKGYRGGMAFQWLAEDDPEQMNLILETVCGGPEKWEPFAQKIRDAVEAKNQAESWLSHLGTLDFDRAELDHIRKVERAERSSKARLSAQTLRKAAILTPEVVASYFNDRPAQKWETVCDDLAELYKVSVRTVARRYKDAKEKNLVT